MWFNTRKKLESLKTELDEISENHEDVMKRAKFHNEQLLSLLPCPGVWESEVIYNAIYDRWYVWITYVEDDEKIIKLCRSFDTPEEAKECEADFGIEFYEWCRYLGNHTYKRRFPPDNPTELKYQESIVYTEDKYHE